MNQKLIFLNLKKLELNLKSNSIDVMKSDRLGYITTDPKNLGTAMKFSVRIKLPYLSKDTRLATILKILDLSPNFRISSETQYLGDNDDDRKNPILEISSKHTLGKSEVIYFDFDNE